MGGNVPDRRAMRVALLLVTCCFSLALVAPHGPYTPPLPAIPQGRQQLPSSPSRIANPTRKVYVDALGHASIPLVEPMRAGAAEAYGSERSEFQGDACGPKAAAPKSLDQCEAALGRGEAGEAAVLFDKAIDARGRGLCADETCSWRSCVTLAELQAGGRD